MPPPEVPSPGALAGAAGADSEAAYFDADAPEDRPSELSNPRLFVASWLRRRFGLPPRRVALIARLAGLGGPQ